MLHFDQPAQRRPAAFGTRVLHEAALQFSPDTSYHPGDLDKARTIDEEISQDDRHFDGLDYGHHLLGWAHSVQFGHLMEERLNEEDDHILLLELDTDEDVGWAWGDAGKLHLFLPREDLKAARFDRVVGTVSSH